MGLCDGNESTPYQKFNMTLEIYLGIIITIKKNYYYSIQLLYLVPRLSYEKPKKRQFLSYRLLKNLLYLFTKKNDSLKHANKNARQFGVYDLRLKFLAYKNNHHRLFSI